MMPCRVGSKCCTMTKARPLSLGTRDRKVPKPPSLQPRRRCRPWATTHLRAGWMSSGRQLWPAF
jgi:hypothetical protein